MPFMTTAVPRPRGAQTLRLARPLHQLCYPRAAAGVAAARRHAHCVSAAAAAAGGGSGGGVCVVGAGVIGLTSALRIKQALPDVAVTVLGEQLQDTTSHCAGGLWKPYTLVRKAGQAGNERAGRSAHRAQHASASPAPSTTPRLQGDTPAELVNRWGRDTLAHYLSLYQSPQAPASGAPCGWAC